MTNNSLPPQLYLLVPWDLPVEEQLSESNRSKIHQVLKHLLQALDENSYQKALAIINQELALLDVSDVLPAEVSDTKTMLKPWEIEDFNNYFKLMHVQTKQPAVCIVWSLLRAYQTFLTFNESGIEFDSIQVKYLKEGLRSYAYMLARVFSLSLEE